MSFLFFLKKNHSLAARLRNAYALLYKLSKRGPLQPDKHRQTQVTFTYPIAQLPSLMSLATIVSICSGVTTAISPPIVLQPPFCMRHNGTSKTRSGPVSSIHLYSRACKGGGGCGICVLFTEPSDCFFVEPMVVRPVVLRKWSYVNLAGGDPPGTIILLA